MSKIVINANLDLGAEDIIILGVYKADIRKQSLVKFRKFGMKIEIIKQEKYLKRSAKWFMMIIQRGSNEKEEVNSIFKKYDEENHLFQVR